MLSYSIDHLKDIGALSRVTLNTGVNERVKTLGIHRKHRRTHRGTRANKIIHNTVHNNIDLSIAVKVSQRPETISKGQYRPRILKHVVFDDHVTSKHCTKVGLINCQSLRGKSDSVQEHIIENQLGLCFLCETWIKSNESDALILQSATPTGYTILSKPRAKDKRGGGVAVIGLDTCNLKDISD